MNPADEASAVFRAEPVSTESWMAIGYVDGDEVWSDGAVVKDKKLAEAIARNMRLAFEAGVDWTKRRAANIVTPPSGDKVFHILVNGQENEWRSRIITYSDICRMLGRDPSRIYSTTYSRGHDPKPDGIVNSCDCVPVRDGMHIESYDTSNA